MKVGLGIPGPILNDETLIFARQAGATHIVAHFVSGLLGEKEDTWLRGGLRRSYENDPRYDYESLVELRDRASEQGLTLESIENFAPADWYDVLLDGPRRDEQMDRVKQVVRNVGRAGIPTMGYNFSIAGVWGRPHQPTARGGALSATFANSEQTPIPRGMVWNMVYDAELYERSLRNGDFVEPISQEQLWDRYSRFLNEILPVAEESGVILALHPDDPPLPELRGAARLVHRAHIYDRVLGLNRSPSNAMEFCVGTLSEMPDQDIYEVVEHFVATGRIQYVHLRNVQGRVPDYRETFIDEGYVDMQRILRILHEGGFDGVVIPDHTPLIATSSPWHTGMAYALGWIRSAMKAVGALER
ncbi:mannonate dehydratase [Microbacterium lacus]|uniref:mannonate dehydratase n=1 Tax=Microbacterium lacus TaxID=415217 RepID=A0ABN2HBG3_9MICO